MNSKRSRYSEFIFILLELDNFLQIKQKKSNRKPHKSDIKTLLFIYYFNKVLMYKFYK